MKKKSNRPTDRTRKTNTASNASPNTQKPPGCRTAPTIQPNNMGGNVDTIARILTGSGTLNRRRHRSNRNRPRPKFDRVRLIIGKHGKR
jgi:hypothetical protein